MSGCYSAYDYCWILVSILCITFGPIGKVVLHKIGAKILLVGKHFVFSYRFRAGECGMHSAR